MFTYASAFSGIEGFGVGFGSVGARPTALIEWDPNAQAILRRQFPTVPLMGDISEVTGSQIGSPDVFVGGFPCQDVSIAAPHRAGLAGRRSGFFFEFARVLEESAAEWAVIENVPGLLRSNDGRDMATVLGVLGDLGYGFAYRVVDGRHFRSPVGRGLRTPQRRQRVLLVGHRGGDPGPCWDVLGDGDTGDEAAAAPSQVGRRPLGLVPAVGLGVSGLWRKSARPRASLRAGGYETWVSDGLANTLTGSDGGGPARQTHLIAQHGRLRTLTFTEWERLQGFADDWTKYGVDPEGNEFLIPTGDLRRKINGVSTLIKAGRYTLLGNAVHTGTSAWLGRRLADVHGSLHPTVRAA